MVLMAAAAAAATAAADDDHGRGRHRRGNPVTAPAPAPAPATATAPTYSHRTRLHSFSFPTVSWGTHRLLRCSKNPTSSPPPPAPDTPSPDKEKARRSTGGDGGGCGGSPQRAPQTPWTFRTRRSATAAPHPGSDAAADAAGDRAAARPSKSRKRRFSIALSKEEIAEDFMAIRGTRPSRRPPKRPRADQKKLDMLFPGLCLADVTPDAYKVDER